MTYAQQQRAANFSSAELAAFSASDVQIDISQGNTVLESFGGSAYLTLLSGSNPVASSQVPLQVDNGVITVEDPAALEAWIQTHGVNANGFDIEFDEMQFSVNHGSNTVHTLVNYGSELIVNRSFAHWVSPNEPICCEQIK